MLFSPEKPVRALTPQLGAIHGRLSALLAETLGCNEEVRGQIDDDKGSVMSAASGLI